MSDSNSKLITTAIGAAVAGAALGVAAIKLLDSKKKNAPEPFASLASDRPIRRSFIYEDTAGDHRESSTTLFPHNHEEKMRRRVVARAAVEEDNLTPRRLVTVRVPATSGNVGPGCKYYCIVPYMQEIVFC